MQCAAKAPVRKVGNSEKLVEADSNGVVQLTAAGLDAARQGEQEYPTTMVLSGRKTKVEATQVLKRKVRSLTMKKDILTLKCWGGKRGELWKCGKAALTQEGCIMVHSAGPFVGYFLVGRVNKFYSVRDAFEWIGHEKIRPTVTINRCEYYLLPQVLYGSFERGISGTRVGHERERRWGMHVETEKER